MPKDTGLSLGPSWGGGGSISQENRSYCWRLPVFGSAKRPWRSAGEPGGENADADCLFTLGCVLLEYRLIPFSLWTLLSGEYS